MLLRQVDSGLGITRSLAACFSDRRVPELVVHSVRELPVWKGTRPYQQIVFQFSIHILDKSGKLSQTQFLDLSGNDPSESLARALIPACGTKGPVFVYNANFEKGCIRELAGRLPKKMTMQTFYKEKGARSAWSAWSFSFLGKPALSGKRSNTMLTTRPCRTGKA